jgi:hypothetical protein
MKKIFTLLVTLLILSSAAFSQSFISTISLRTPNLSIDFGHHYDQTYSYTRYDRDMQIAKINAAYDQQVREVMNLRMSARKKVDIIQQLERERNIKIQNLNNYFFDNRDQYNRVQYNGNSNCR